MWSALTVTSSHPKQISATSRHRPTAAWRGCGEAGTRWGVLGKRVDGSGGKRTVDEQAERDCVDDDHHGHRGFAFALGAFSPGVVDEFLISASEKAAHDWIRNVCVCDRK